MGEWTFTDVAARRVWAAAESLRHRPGILVWIWAGAPVLSPRTIDLLDAHLPVGPIARPAGHCRDRRQQQVAGAWVAAAAGAVSQAAALAQRAAVPARDDADGNDEVVALHAAVCFGDPDGAARPAALADTVAAALAAADGAALDAVAARLSDRGALPAAADAAAQAAQAHANAGSRGPAVASAARALELARRCGDAVTPALRAAARPLPLTVREREITSLAAGGMSSKEIAARLAVSVRTVEDHIYRACAKPHVDTRAGLEAVLG
jgi:DNA-binding CsgD family transcriptional regulator